MVTAQEVGEVFSFVARELIRLQQMGTAVTQELKGLEFLCTIRGSDGGKRFIGRPAYDRLRDLTARTVAVSPYRGRLDLDRTFTCVRDGFGRDFIRPGFKGTTDEEDFDFLKSWIDEAATACKTLTHYVPTHIRLPVSEDFVVGPVKVEPAEVVLARLEPTLASWPRLESESDLRWRPEDSKAALNYLGAFSDVASVTVHRCDSETSRLVSSEIVEAAIAFLHVMAGAERTKKVRIGGPATPNAHVSTFALGEGDVPSRTWVGDWEGARLDKSFWPWMREPEQMRLADAAGTALQFLADRIEPPLMAARYLDAAAWYADAVTEGRRPAAILKYLTAMERLLWTGKGKITERLSSRAAALCFTTDPWNFEALKRDIRRAYGLRSDIVHGRIRNDDPALMQNYWLCERVSRDLLTTWLFRYGADFHRDTTLEKLEAHLDGFVLEVTQETAKRQDEKSASDVSR